MPYFQHDIVAEEHEAQGPCVSSLFHNIVAPKISLLCYIKIIFKEKFSNLVRQEKKYSQ